MISKIIASSLFNRHVKELQKKHYKMSQLYNAIEAIKLEKNDLLKTKYRAHALKGNYKGFSELHVASDWLLVYKIEKDPDGFDTLVLFLTDTGSHDDIFKKRG